MDEPIVYPANGKRVVFYLFHDSRGDVDDYIVHKLDALRPHVEHIFVVVNGKLTDLGRERLAPVADTVWQRENVGFDVGGYKDALEEFGQRRLAEYDELILMNYTWFGPVRPFAPVFDRMNASAVDFWGVTDHAEEPPDPSTGRGGLHRHLQTHWISVRRRMFLSQTWSEYWRDMPKMTSYADSILHHEARFTHHFEALGFRSAVAFSSADYPSDNPAIFNADLLLADGCPILKRRQFFHYPPFLDRHAVIGRWTLKEAEKYDYPVWMILRNLARNVAPHTLNADLAMLEVLPDVDVTAPSNAPMRIAVVAHVDHLELARDLLRRVAMFPSPFDLYVTTTNPAWPSEIESILGGMDVAKMETHEIRVIPVRGGNDMSAFFVGCRDVLSAGAYDLVAKVRTMPSSRRTSNADRYVARQQLESLMSSSGYIANLLALFTREVGLGVVFPPMAHIGFDRMGRGWGVDGAQAVELMKALKIRVPADDVSPLAPVAGMWVARPEALRLIADFDWSYQSYAKGSSSKGTRLAYAQELIVVHAAGERGYHTRTVLNESHASISHTSLEYKVDQLLSTTIGYPHDQIQFLHRAGWMGRAGLPALSRMYLRLHWPRTARLLLPLNNVTRRAIYMLRALRSSPENLSPAENTPDEGSRS
ncbi:MULTISPECIES: rhamnan synthesis F family protein [unclassified Microbacterium]|uniref:rhamnan synthesis F family protein n=1 Tax=unclassified Microbacterium TaxID=2609290 RepID=UPI0013D4EBFE|nr:MULTISPECIES: rhamnan synthesis F family protein [unclassified Microbacterium]